MALMTREDNIRAEWKPRKDWWTKDDADKFKARADEVAEQYDALNSMDTIHVNGEIDHWVKILQTLAD